MFYTKFDNGDMHGLKFGRPLIKDQDPQVVHDASDTIH
jgi:hypothetical protein